MANKVYTGKAETLVNVQVRRYESGYGFKILSDKGSLVSTGIYDTAFEALIAGAERAARTLKRMGE